MVATTRYTQLPIVSGLDGTEIVPLDQSDGLGGYVTRRTTTGAIAALGLTPTGVSAGTYGSSTLIPQFTVDEDGRLSFAGNVVPTFPGTGTVTSVGLAAPADLTVTGSPVTNAGTLTLDWATPPTGTGAMVRATSPALVTPNLGTPSAAVLTNATGLPIVGGTTGTLSPTRGGTGLATYAQGDLLIASAANVLSALAIGAPGQTLVVNGGGTGLQYSSAGSGTVTSVSVVSANGFAGSVATDTTTPAITLSTTITGILQGNGTAISAATTTGTGDVVLANSPTLVTPALGTPSALVLTNATGLPVASGISGLGTGVATWLATPSSANLAAAVTDETGSGALVFATSPTLVTPTLGVASATSINKVALTAPATGSTLTIADGKTLTASNSLTLAGTDSTTMTFPGTSSTVLTTGNTALLTVGRTVTPANLGTVSSGTTTLAGADGQTQYYTNNGAHTLAAPAADTAIDVLITNGASAGAITFSGFTVGSATGSPLTTTNGQRFLVSVRRINGISTYSIYALQ
jgi:hypothetical protein